MLNSTITNGDLTLNWQQNRLTCAGRYCHLRPKLCDLLYVFLEQPGVVLSRTYLRNRLYGYQVEDYRDESLTLAICNLRQALRSIGSALAIEAFQYRGYMLNSSDPGLIHLTLTKKQHRALQAILHEAERHQPDMYRMFLAE